MEESGDMGGVLIGAKVSLVSVVGILGEARVSASRRGQSCVPRVDSCRHWAAMWLGLPQ